MEISKDGHRIDILEYIFYELNQFLKHHLTVGAWIIV